MMASKLFSKLGHKKKHLVAPPTPDVDYDKDTATSQNASVATSLFIGHREVSFYILFWPANRYSYSTIQLK